MAILHVQDQVADALNAQAKAQGVSLETYLQQIVELKLVQQPADKVDSARDFNLALDEFFAQEGKPLPPTSLSYSREDIYFDHD